MAVYTSSGILGESPLSGDGPAAAVQLKHRKATTRRGLATASVCLGLFGFATFWMYPFGMLLGGAGAALGSLAVALNIRAGNEGQHLAWVGIVFGGSAVGAGVTVYRFFQLMFEDSIPVPLPF